VTVRPSVSLLRLPLLAAALLLSSGCAGLDAHLETGPVDTHLQATDVSGCITQRCMDEPRSDAYAVCEEQCRKRRAR
jgi:hypothetical protein